MEREETLAREWQIRDFRLKNDVIWSSPCKMRVQLPSVFNSGVLCGIIELRDKPSYNLYSFSLYIENRSLKQILGLGCVYVQGAQRLLPWQGSGEYGPWVVRGLEWHHDYSSHHCVISRSEVQVAGKAGGDQVAVGLSCYSDSSVCKDCGVTWLLRTLDSTREMKSYDHRLKNTHRDPEALHTALKEFSIPSNFRVDTAEG